MVLLRSFEEWKHRRYLPLTHWYQQSVPNGVQVGGDVMAPPKGALTGWRRKWAYCLVYVSPVDQGYSEDSSHERRCYWPGYSYDGGNTFRRTVWPVRTICFAFQIGPHPVQYSVFGRDGELIKYHLDLSCEGVTWTEVIKKAGSLESVTFV